MIFKSQLLRIFIKRLQPFLAVLGLLIAASIGPITAHILRSTGMWPGHLILSLFVLLISVVLAVLVVKPSMIFLAEFIADKIADKIDSIIRCSSD